MNLYNYKKYPFTCRKCGWQGLGAETVRVGDIPYGDGIGCPLCRDMIKCVYWPNAHEVLL